MADTSELKMFIPITKVDLKKREVWGRATQEIKDGHGEIMDFASSAPMFKKWSEDAMQRSGGKSKGNIREMHQAIAAGKVIDIQFNDSEKAIDIGTYVSDDGSWQKVLDGVLTGFSIGGDYAKRWNDPSNYSLTRYTAAPAEISLVDVPAVSTALFAMVKLDGSTEMRKLGDPISVMVEVDKAEGLIEPLVNELDKNHEGAPGIPAQDVPIEMGSTDGARPPDEAVPQEVLSGYQAAEITADGQGVPSVDDARNQEIPTNPDGLPNAPVTTASPDVLEAVAKLQSSLDAAIQKLNTLHEDEAIKKSQTLAELKSRSSRVGIARRESEPLTPPENAPSDWQVYADPVNWKFPLTKRENASEAIVLYNNGANRALYSPAEWNVVGRRITRLASTVFGEMYKFNPTRKRVERVIKEKTMATPLKKDADFMGVLRELGAGLSAAVEMIGSNPDAAKDLLVQALGAIDVASDVSAANPESPAAPSLSAADSIPSAPSASMTMAASPVSAPSAPSASPAAEPSTPSTPSGSTPSFDKVAEETEIMKMLKAMQEQINSLTKKQEAAAAQQQLPLGDLNALLNKINGVETPTESDDEFIKTLSEGNLEKAFELVGYDMKKMLEKANAGAVRGIFDSGINVSKYQFLTTSVDEPAK